MILIDRVNITYFRSFYSEQVKGISDLNIVLGKNDSGKSNFLRALNLFFNFETIKGHPFEFDKDYSKKRINESKKNSDLVIKIRFKTPSGYKGSLGEFFEVSRYWNRDSEKERLQFKKDNFHKLEPKNEKYAKGLIAKIHYHYIPAIKDRKIFGTLLAELYQTISKDSEFGNSLSQFTNELANQTQRLTKGLLENAKIHSSLAPPIDLTTMFQSLDFNTGNNYGSSMSLIFQRGDGVQVRHIPEILAFIADNNASADYHIWGFEEPENSLDLGSAIREAELFQDHSISTNKQIFLTSHSPAFYTLEGERVSRYFAYEPPDEQFETKMKKLSEEVPAELMNDIPYLDTMSVSLKKAKAEISELRFEANRLTEKVQNTDKPLLLVEGESDKKILQKAWSVIFEDEPLPFEIEEVKGTSGFLSLKDQRGGLAKAVFPNRLVFCLLDNDRDGLKATPSNLKINKNPGQWVEQTSGNHNNETKVFWCTLRHSNEHNLWSDLVGLKASNAPCTIESCFSSELRIKALEKSSYGFEEGYYAQLKLSDGGAGSLEKKEWDSLQKFSSNVWKLTGALEYGRDQTEEQLIQSIFDCSKLDTAIVNGNVRADQICEAFSIWFKAPNQICKINFPNWIMDNSDLTKNDFGSLAEILVGIKSKISESQEIND